MFDEYSLPILIYESWRFSHIPEEFCRTFKIETKIP